MAFGEGNGIACVNDALEFFIFYSFSEVWPASVVIDGMPDRNLPVWMKSNCNGANPTQHVQNRARKIYRASAIVRVWK